MRERVVLSGDHRGWARECRLNANVAPRPWLPAVKLMGESLWGYRSVCRNCSAEVNVYGGDPDRYCRGCGESLTAPDETDRCVVCGSRALAESLKGQHPDSSIFLVSDGMCHECGHIQPGGWVRRADGSEVHPGTLADLRA